MKLLSFMKFDKLYLCLVQIFLLSSTNCNHSEVISILFLILSEWQFYTVSKIIIRAVRLYCMLSSEVLCFKLHVVSCPYQWSHWCIFVMTMPRWMYLGFGGHALLQIPLTACEIIFLVSYSNHVVCFLSPPPCFSQPYCQVCFQLIRISESWTALDLGSCSLFVIWSTWPGWQPCFLFSSHGLSCCFPVGCLLGMCSQIFQCQILLCFITSETSASCLEYSMRYICI